MPRKKSKMNSKRKCCQYLEEYLQFGFIPSPSNVQLPMCLVCGKSFSNEAMKPSRLLDHLKTNMLIKKVSQCHFFQDLKDKFGKKNTITRVVCNMTFDLVFAECSYVISVIAVARSYVMNYFRLRCITSDYICIISVYICMISVCT